MLKKIGLGLLVVFLLVLPFGWIPDTSYKIEDVQIRGWIEGDGTMAVNEIYTYSLHDDELTKLTRVFPARHREQIYNFQAYEVKDGQGKVGFVDGSNLKKLPVSMEDEIWKTEIPQQHSGSVQVMYIYRINEAVKTYQNYSDVDMTFFEDGPNHDTDIHNIDLSFILEDGVGEQNLHGFLHASDAREPIVHTNGIEFETPVSRAHTTLSARLFYPSSIMTDQRKRTAPRTLEEAIAQEELKLERQTGRQGMIPVFQKAVMASGAILILILLFVLWMRLRLIGRFGSVRYVLETDPLYLSFVDHAGNWHRKSFLAGLFSLVDQKAADLTLAEPAGRLADQPGVTDTLEFHLKKGRGDLLPFERRMAVWLFRGSVLKQQFHLHEIASGKESDEALRRQHAFEINQKGWHEEVRDLLVDSGTLSRRLAAGMRAGVLLASFSVSVWAFWLGEPGTWLVLSGIPAILLAVAMAGMKNSREAGPALAYFVVTIFFINSIGLVELRAVATIFLMLSFFVYYRIPETVLSSRAALYAKMSINKFRWEMQKGVPEWATEEQKEQFLIRAYLLKASERSIPSVPGSQGVTSPVSALFALPADPVQFVFTQWGKPLLDKKGNGPEAKTADSSSDGGYAGESGGGGGDGGGGAGAD